MTYQKQRKASDRYLNSFKEILEDNSKSFLSIEVSDEDKDTQEATDMVVNVIGGDVALRVRNANLKYRDITIRSRSKHGGKTEIDKIKEGFADWYLYGWGRGGTVEEYVLFDLERVRNVGMLEARRNQIMNRDGTGFINIEIGELQMAGCIVNKEVSETTQLKIDSYIKNRMYV